MTYEATILATSPVLYLPMQGATITEEVRSVTATVTGAAVQQAGPVAGMEAIGFTGSNNSVVVATHTSYHPGNTFSIGGWFNRTAAGDGSGASVYHAGSNELTVWFPPATGVGRLTLRKAGVADIWRSTQLFDTPYNAGWTHFIYTKSGATTALYINGVANGATVADQTITTTTNDPTFGNASGAINLDYVGLMSHMAIWNVALTSTQAEDLYDATFLTGGGARSQAVIIG